MPTWSGDPKLDAAADLFDKAFSGALLKVLPEATALCGENAAHIAMIMCLTGRIKKIIKVGRTAQFRQDLASLVAAEIEMLQAESSKAGRA